MNHNLNLTYFSLFKLFREAFQEMIDYEELIYTVFEYDDSVKTEEGITKPMLGNKVYFEDIC